MTAIKLHDGDMRCATLLQALKDVIYERGLEIPVPSIIGIIELLKVEILEEQKA